MIRWLRNLSLVIVTLAISVFFVNGGAYAATNVSSSIADKAFYQAVYNCYTSGHVDRTVNPLSQYVNAANPLKFLTYGSDRSEDNIPLVSGWEGRNYKNNDNGVRCDELLNGFSVGGSYAGLMKAFGKSAPKAGDADGITKLVENLGYTVITSGEDKCYSLNYVGVTETLLQGEVTDSGRTNQVCQKSDGKLYVDTMGNTTRFTADGEEVCLFVASSVTHHGKCTKLGDSQFSGEWLMSVVKNACGGAECSWNDTTSGQSGTVTFDSSIEGGSQSGISLKNSSAQFINNDSWAAAKTAVSFLSDGKITSSDDMHLTELEKRLLYQAYFTDYYKAEVDCREGQSDELYDGKFNWLDSDKTIKECHYSFSKATNKDKAVNGVNTLRDFEFESIPNLEALAEEIKNLPTDYPSDEIEAADAEGAVSDPSGTDCMGLDLSGQGWVLCPALENGASTSDGFLAMIDGMLSVKSELYNNDSGTFKAWEVFRTFANIFLSIILLVIIISQVTGFGINNYGIKKMLPRFIVVAILINLSYVLCQIAVDVSNILGDGLNNLFQGIAGGIGGTFLWSSGNFVSEVVAGIMGALGAGGAALGAILPFAVGAEAIAAPLVIVALLLAVLVAVVSVLMFFVMLGARMVIIVVFIAIAPVAIACFILPNTQTLYKKWWNIFKAALVMYPLCGLLYGLSFVIKAMFGSSGTPGLWEGIVLILTPFLPFLVLPNLLKSALAGLGVIGGALTSVGNGLRSGLQSGANAVKNTETYKSQAEDVARQRQLRNADRIINRMNKRMANNGGELISRDARRLARATGIRDRLKGEDLTAGVAALESLGLSDDELKARWDKAYKDNASDLDVLSSALISRLGAGGASHIAKQLDNERVQDAEGNVDQRVAGALKTLQATARQNPNFAKAFSSNQDALRMINSGGITGHDSQGNPTYGDLRDFRADYLRSDTDWASQSAGAIKRAMGYGQLSADQAERILSSQEQSVMSALDDEKRRELQAGIYNQRSNPSGVGPQLSTERAAELYMEGVAEAEVQSTGGDVAIEQGARAVGGGGVTDTGSAGATLRMTGASGEQVLTRQADGRWVDENGNDMGGNFSTRVENDARLQRQIEENAKKMEVYRNMSDERILELATDPNPKNAKIQASAVEEAKRRGL